MRVSRLFLPGTLAPRSERVLGEDAAHYVRDVLRLAVGDGLVVFNGEGGEWAARVVAMRRHEAVLAIDDFHPREAESPRAIRLALGVTRGERMDYAIQKAVELGAARVSPLLTERCVVRMDPARWSSRLEHWRKVAASASEQCGRNRLLCIDAPCAFGEWLALQSGPRFVCDPAASVGLSAQPEPEGDELCLLTGPEGGLSPWEREAAVASGFVPVRLGPRILRAETAAVAALTVLQTLWGDLA